MIPFGRKLKQQRPDEASDIADFSDYADTKRINGFQHMSESALNKLKRELKLRMSAKSLRSLRKYFAGANAPTVLALKVVDAYWSSGNGYLERGISQIELATDNPHVLKALRLYDKLREEFRLQDSPRTLKEMLTLSAKAVISDSRDVVRYSYGKYSLECECYEKGRRTRYFSDIVSRWDADASNALRRCATISTVSGGTPVAVIKEEHGECTMRERRNFGRFAESLDLPAYDYGSVNFNSSASFAETALLCTRDSFDVNSDEISASDRILLITFKNTERDGLKELGDFLAECNASKLISRAFSCDEGILNELIAAGKGFEINVPDLFAAKGRITDFLTGRHLDRIVAVARKQNVSKLLSLVDKYDFAASVIGRITSKDNVRIIVSNTEVVKLHLTMLKHRSHAFSVFRVDDKPYVAASVTTVTDDIADLKQKLAEGKLRTESALNGVNSARSVLPPFIGKYQSTPAQIAAITPSPDRYEDVFNALAAGTRFDGYDIFSETVNTALAAILKLVVSGVSIYNIALDADFLFANETDSIGRGALLARALACLYTENSLSVAGISANAQLARFKKNTQVFSVTATGSAPVSLLISPDFSQGDKLFRLGIPRDEFGIPDFKYVLKLAAAININIGTGNITAARLIEDSVLESVIKGTAGNGLGFSFATFETDGARNAKGDLLLAVHDIEELSAFECEYVGVTDDTGILKNADTSISQTEVAGYLSKYPFENKADDRVPQAPVAVKKTVRRATSVKQPTMTILHCDYSSEFAVQSLATAVGFNVNSMYIGKETVASSVLQRKVRERIAATDMLVVCGRSAYGEYFADNRLYDVLHRPVVLDAINELIFRNDGLVLGTGEGSRALLKLGYLSYGNAEHSASGAPALKEAERSGIISQLVRLRISNNLSPMLTFADVGKYYYAAPGGNDMRFTANPEVLGQMAFGGQIAAQYADCHGFPTVAYPYNPDGSADAVAALTSPAGRVLGFFCLPEKTPFLKFETSLIRDVIASAADYFRNGSEEEAT